MWKDTNKAWLVVGWYNMHLQKLIESFFLPDIPLLSEVWLHSVFGNCTIWKIDRNFWSLLVWLCEEVDGMEKERDQSREKVNRSFIVSSVRSFTEDCRVGSPFISAVQHCKVRSPRIREKTMGEDLTLNMTWRHLYIYWLIVTYS